MSDTGLQEEEQKEAKCPIPGINPGEWAKVTACVREAEGVAYWEDPGIMLVLSAAGAKIKILPESPGVLPPREWSIYNYAHMFAEMLNIGAMDIARWRELRRFIQPVRLDDGAARLPTQRVEPVPERVVPGEDERTRVFAKTSGLCFYCGSQLQKGWHVDHFVPRSKGGPNDMANYVPACPRCNLLKHDRMPTDSERAKFGALNIS